MRPVTPGLRVFMAVLGVATLAFYGVAAYVLYIAIRVAWVNRPDPVAFVAILAAATLLSGYLTYRFGTGRALLGLDARELPRSSAPGVYAIRDRLVRSMDLPAVPVYVARLGEPNALALGGANPVLVLDVSLFRILDGPELEGVLAHELAHLENRDGLVQTLAHSAVQTLVGIVAFALAPLAIVAGGFARGIALLGGEPGGWHRTAPGRLRTGLAQALTLLLLGLTLLVRAHSRRREHAADDRAVAVTGRPLALASALRKIERASSASFPFAPLYREGTDEPEHPLARLLSTHPSMDERVERLRARAARMGATESRWTRIPVRE